MRAIKFRGFSKKQNKWVFGYYARNFICDKIIGKPQKFTQLSLFDNIES